MGVAADPSSEPPSASCDPSSPLRKTTEVHELARDPICRARCAGSSAIVDEREIAEFLRPRVGARVWACMARGARRAAVTQQSGKMTRASSPRDG